MFKAVFFERLLFSLLLAVYTSKAWMPRSVQGCFSGTALGCQIIIFLPRREKKADAFPAFFSR
jgi:hypothetical protein